MYENKVILRGISEPSLLLHIALLAWNLPTFRNKLNGPHCADTTELLHFKVICLIVVTV